jgi:hypothetical protein
MHLGVQFLSICDFGHVTHAVNLSSRGFTQLDAHAFMLAMLYAYAFMLDMVYAYAFMLNMVYAYIFMLNMLYAYYKCHI